MNNNRRLAGFSLVELVIAVSILVMMTGALSPALVRYIEKGRERRDTQSIELVYSALTGALYDEAAYDAVLSGLGCGGTYAEPISVQTLFEQDDRFSEAVRDYVSSVPKLASKEAMGSRGQYEIMISVREERDPATGIRALQTAVWAGDGAHCAAKEYQSGVLPDYVAVNASED